MEHNSEIVNGEILDVSSVRNLQHIHGELTKINRGIEGGSLHFITVPRDQDIIEGSLLNSEVLSSGILIDSVTGQQIEGEYAINHQGLVERHYINEHYSDEIHLQTEVSEQDRKLASSFYQLVNKPNSNNSNEAQVIVTNKEMATLTPIQETEKNYMHEEEHFISENNSKLYQNSNPPLPPLTPIRRLRRKQNAIFNDNLQNMSGVKTEDDEEEEEYKTVDDEMLSGNEEKSLISSPKKSLPHKKRITKKLRNNKKRNMHEDEHLLQQQQQHQIQQEPHLQEQELELEQEQEQEHLQQEQDVITIDISNQDIDTSSLSNVEIMKFSCEICGAVSNCQIEFFAHLKNHYEPIPSNIKMEVLSEEQPRNDKTKTKMVRLKQVDMKRLIEISNQESNKTEVKYEIKEIDEFSETEDMLEGIQGVVDKVQEDSNDELTEWYEDELHATITSDMESRDIKEINSSTDDLYFIQQKDDNEKQNDDVIEVVKMTKTTKKGKASVTKKKNTKTDDTQKKVTKKRGKAKNKENVDLIKEDGSVAIDVDTDDETHSSDKKVKQKCDKCGKVFNSKNAFHYHSLSHSGIRPHQCDVCGKSFFAASALKVHLRLHSGAKPYHCKYCQRAFRQWGDMKYHITSLHTDEKSFQCEFCGKNFARRYSLVIHRRIHTGERNYSCEFCTKSFRASSYLANHRRIHTGEKPHECPVCMKKFRVRSDMKRHIATHNRDKGSKKATTTRTSTVIKTEPSLIITDVIEEHETKYQPSDNEDVVYNDHHIYRRDNDDEEISGSSETGTILKNELMRNDDNDDQEQQHQQEQLIKNKRIKVRKVREMKVVPTKLSRSDNHNKIITNPLTLSPNNLPSTSKQANTIIQTLENGTTITVDISKLLQSGNGNVSGSKPDVNGQNGQNVLVWPVFMS